MAQGEWENHKYVNRKWVNGRWVYDYGAGYSIYNKAKETAGQIKKYGANGVKSYGAQNLSELKGKAGHVYYETPRQLRRGAQQVSNKIGSTAGAIRRKVRHFAKNAQGRLKIVKRKLDRLSAESRAKVLRAYKKIKSDTRGFRNAVKKGYRDVTLPVRATTKKAYKNATRSLRTSTARVKSKARRVSNSAKRNYMKQQHIRSMSPRRKEAYERYLQKKKQQSKGR